MACCRCKQLADVCPAAALQPLYLGPQEGMQQLAEREGGSGAAAGKLNNVLMQMRKICNHPDLITSAFRNDIDYPSVEALVEQCGKMQLLDRLLTRLHARGHKVLIFSQVRRRAKGWEGEG